MKPDVLPFIVISENGEILTLLQTNEKGYKKSIENSRIWAVNTETQRLLPEDDYGRTLSFREKPGWYEVTVEAVSSGEKEIAPSESEIEKKTAVAGSGSDIIERLYAVIEERKESMPEGSYTTHLFKSGPSKIRKKTGEEAIELLLAENHDETVYEAADLIYHMLVMLAAESIRPEEIFMELERRE